MPDKDELQRLRRTPITAKKVAGKNLVNECADRLLMYPPRDLRLEEQEVEPIDIDYMVDMVENMRAAITSKQFDKGTFTVAYKLVTNLEDIKVYNEVVNEFNEEMFPDKDEEQAFIDDNMGYDEGYDYANGEEKALKDKVSPIRIEKQFDYNFDDPINAPGDFGKNRPAARYATRLTVQYQISLTGEDFTLGYVARDMKGRVLYYDEATGTNLTDLIRRSVQRLWGNPVIGSSILMGSFYEGVAMLVQGRKTRYCKNNIKPSIMGPDEHLHTFDVSRPIAGAAEKTTLGIARLMAFLVPVTGVIAVIAFIIWGINQYDLDTGVFPEGTLTTFLVGLAILIIIYVGLSKLPKHIYRSAEEQHMRRKFL
jgi:hypothetical protein